MKHKLLLMSTAMALTLGLSPVFAQDRSDVKRDQPAARQQDQKIDQNRSTVKGSTDERSDKSTNAANDSRSPQKSSDESSGLTRKDATSDKTTGAPKRDDTGKTADQTKSTDSNKIGPTDRDTTNSKAANDANKKSQPNERSSAADPNAAKPAEPTNRAATTNERSPGNAMPSRSQDQANRNGETRVRVSASLDPAAKTKLRTAITKIDARPVTNVNFSISVGTVVPHTVTLRPLPSTIVEIIPQYRDYDYFVVREDIIIVEPGTHKIVDVIARSGPGHAEESTTVKRKPQLTKEQREIIHKRYSSRRATTGTTVRTEEDIAVGRVVPDSVEIEAFPEEVYREVPAIRSYRYIQRNDNIYLIDPGDRRVIEEIE